MKYLIITKRIWDKKNFLKLNKNILVIKSLKKEKIDSLKPKIIFFIHWSKIIEEYFFKNYLCIQFHASNLPMGRGGSPIQNQIIRGIKKTKISAFKIDKNLDRGPICLKKNFSLKGNLSNILKRMEKTCITMIKQIIKNKKLKFHEQKGKISFYKRRKKNDSAIFFQNLKNLNDCYDFIRMLDANDYPNAYVDNNKFRFSFKNVKRYKNYLTAETKIYINEKK
jgi:methionyl-tRNA formyltransferase